MGLEIRLGEPGSRLRLGWTQYNQQAFSCQQDLCRCVRLEYHVIAHIVFRFKYDYIGAK